MNDIEATYNWKFLFSQKDYRKGLFIFYYTPAPLNVDAPQYFSLHSS